MAGFAAASLAADGDHRRASRHARAWCVLVGALALHVVDEAATGFLGFYNPLVASIRAQLPWFPMPTFTFGVWLGGLALVVVLLALQTPAVRRGARGVITVSWIFSGIMVLNGIGHLGGSLYFGRWLPGATSAPIILGAGLLLARRTRERSGSSR